MFGFGSILSSIAPIASGLLGSMGSQSPAAAASPYFDEAKEALQQYSAPYVNRGNQSSDLLQQVFSKLISNPQDVLGQLQGSYTSSPGYQFNYNQAMQGLGNAAASGGMSGSLMHQQQAADLGSNYASRDFSDYMNRALGLYGTGLQGMQGFSNMGWDASKTLMEDLASLAGAQGAYAAQDVAGRNQSNSSLLGGAGSVLSQLLGGGNSGSGSSSDIWSTPQNWVEPQVSYPTFENSFIPSFF